jgi:hypothetical protein
MGCIDGCVGLIGKDVGEEQFGGLNKKKKTKSAKTVSFDPTCPL